MNQFKEPNNKEGLFSDLVESEHVLGEETKGIKTSRETISFMKKLKEQNPEKFKQLQEEFLEKAREQGWVK